MGRMGTAMVSDSDDNGSGGECRSKKIAFENESLKPNLKALREPLLA
jgi:hypothetical protein